MTRSGRPSLILLCAALAGWLGAAAPARGEQDTGFALKLDGQLGEAHADEQEGRPLYASGDRLHGRAGRETTLEGAAELRKGGAVIRADRLTYWHADDEVAAVGNVRIVRQGNVFTGPSLQLKLDANEGVFESPSYSLPLVSGRGSAERVEFLGPDRTRLTNATYTTCKPCSVDWLLRLDSLTIDEKENEASGSKADLMFKGVRILRAPAFAFPLSDERRSGVLAPTFSVTSKGGVEAMVPYYFNIAPNRDFTFFPRLSSRRGLQLGGEFRYLEPDYFGDVRFEVNPNDLVTGEQRYFWQLRNTFTNWAGWSGGWQLRGVSDDNYFVDYSRSIVASADRVLPRTFSMSRMFGPDWTVLFALQKWQAILEARPGPYERVPQLQARHLVRDVGGFDINTVWDATVFQAPTSTQPEGTRAYVNPQITWPILRAGGFVIPKLWAHASTYQLSQNYAYDTSLNRVVPGVSLDSGLVFERPASYFGRGFTQTLEPRIFYARTLYRDQSQIPVFDTTVADFNFAQLFSENTFVGNDRIADVNQVTLAAVSRLVDPANGAERLRLAIGQRIYLSDQKVSLPGQLPPTDNKSDLLLAVAGDMGGGMSFDSGLQYSVESTQMPRLNFAWRYRPLDGRILNAGVRYRTDEIGQIDTSWRWPVAERWMALGRVNWSFLDQGVDPVTRVPNQRGIVEAVAGFEFNEDCWGLRFVVQRFTTSFDNATTAFFIQFELKGLARVGQDPFDILRRNIPGYRLPVDRPELPTRYFGYE